MARVMASGNEKNKQGAYLFSFDCGGVGCSSIAVGGIAQGDSGAGCGIGGDHSGSFQNICRPSDKDCLLCVVGWKGNVL